MKIRLNLPDGERTFPIPSPMILQLLSNQIPNAPIRRYLQEPGRCQQLYTELERCASAEAPNPSSSPFISLSKVAPSIFSFSIRYCATRCS